MDTYSRLWSAAAYTRLAATQVQCLLPSDQVSTSAKLTDMKTKLSEFSSERHKFLRKWRQKKESNGKPERLAIFRSKHHPDVIKGLLRCNKLAKNRESQLSEVCSVTDRMLTEHAELLSQPLEIQICIEPDGTFKSSQMILSPLSGAGRTGYVPPPQHARTIASPPPGQPRFPVRR